MIVKTGADLRQEQLAVQLIQEFRRIWKEENCQCWVRQYAYLTFINNYFGRSNLSLELPNPHYRRYFGSRRNHHGCRLNTLNKKSRVRTTVSRRTIRARHPHGPF